MSTINRSNGSTGTKVLGWEQDRTQGHFQDPGGGPPEVVRDGADVPVAGSPGGRIAENEERGRSTRLVATHPLPLALRC